MKRRRSAAAGGYVIAPTRSVPSSTAATGCTLFALVARGAAPRGDALKRPQLFAVARSRSRPAALLRADRSATSARTSSTTGGPSELLAAGRQGVRRDHPPRRPGGRGSIVNGEHRRRLDFDVVDRTGEPKSTCSAPACRRRCSARSIGVVVEGTLTASGCSHRPLMVNASQRVPRHPGTETAEGARRPDRRATQAAVTASLGYGLILVALFAAPLGVVVGFAPGTRQRDRAAAGCSAGCYAFLRRDGRRQPASWSTRCCSHDFSVKLRRAGRAAALTPTWCTIVQPVGALEGSILFWGCVLGVYVLRPLARWLQRIPSTPVRCRRAGSAAVACSSPS